MHVYNNFKNFDAEYFCDVEYQIFHLNSNKKKRFLWCQIPIFLFFFFIFANLKKKDFCDVQYQILGEIPTVWYAMKNLKTHACMYICIEANAACITNWQKKREGGGKKTVYLFTTVKKHQTLTKVFWQPVSLT